MPCSQSAPKGLRDQTDTVGADAELPGCVGDSRNTFALATERDALTRFAAALKLMKSCASAPTLRPVRFAVSRKNSICASAVVVADVERRSIRTGSLPMKPLSEGEAQSTGSATGATPPSDTDCCSAGQVSSRSAQ